MNCHSVNICVAMKKRSLTVTIWMGFKFGSTLLHTIQIVKPFNSMHATVARKKKKKRKNTNKKPSPIVYAFICVYCICIVRQRTSVLLSNCAIRILFILYFSCSQTLVWKCFDVKKEKKIKKFWNMEFEWC